MMTTTTPTNTPARTRRDRIERWLETHTAYLLAEDRSERDTALRLVTDAGMELLRNEKGHEKEYHRLRRYSLTLGNLGRRGRVTPEHLDGVLTDVAAIVDLIRAQPEPAPPPKRVTAKEAAEEFKLNPDALRKRVERWNETHVPGCFAQIPIDTSTGPMRYPPGDLHRCGIGRSTTEWKVRDKWVGDCGICQMQRDLVKSD